MGGSLSKLRPRILEISGQFAPRIFIPPFPQKLSPKKQYFVTKRIFEHNEFQNPRIWTPRSVLIIMHRLSALGVSWGPRFEAKRVLGRSGAISGHSGFALGQRPRIRIPRDVLIILDRLLTLGAVWSSICLTKTCFGSCFENLVVFLAYFLSRVSELHRSWCTDHFTPLISPKGFMGHEIREEVFLVCVALNLVLNHVCPIRPPTHKHPTPPNHPAPNLQSTIHPAPTQPQTSSHIPTHPYASLPPSLKHPPTHPPTYPTKTVTYHAIHPPTLHRPHRLPNLPCPKPTLPPTPSTSLAHPRP